MTVVVYRCTGCGHEWPRRFARKPKVCPKCKRYDWEHGKRGGRMPKRKETANG